MILTRNLEITIFIHWMKNKNNKASHHNLKNEQY
jgi:hypothetical protein